MNSQEERSELIRRVGFNVFSLPAETGEMRYPELEFVRSAIPRRVYTSMHMRYVAEAILSIYRNRERIKGLRIVEEPRFSRHFTAKLEEIEE